MIIISIYMGVTGNETRLLHVYKLYMLIRDAEGRKKEASKVIQTTRQSNTTHPRQSLFQRKMSCLVCINLYTCSGSLYILCHL